MCDGAEHSIADHVEDHHFGFAIAAVLQDEAVLASGFGSIHNVPAFLQRGAGRHFDGSMLAILHGVQRHGHMPIPWGCYVHHVEIELIQVLEIRIALAEAGRLWLSRIADGLLRLRDFFWNQVADCLDLHFVYPQQVLQEAGSASADPNDPQAYLISGLKRDADHSCAHIFRGSCKEVG
jgi:hypothetical protein